MPAHFDLPRAVASLKESRVPVSRLEVRICPGVRGYWCAIYDADTMATNPLHETGTLDTRDEALELAEIWIGKKEEPEH